MSELLSEDRGAVRILTMNRPDKRNALNNALTAALLNALQQADADDDVGCVLLTGAAPAFCAGADLAEFAKLTPENQHLVDERAALTANLQGIFMRMSTPVVTAINGAAMGGGAGLAIGGDIALMGAGARIGYPEIRHGIVAAIVMPNLVRHVGRKAAFEIVATGATVDAERALELGLVSRVVDDGALMAEAMKTAETLAGWSRPAMAATKSLFYQAVDLPFEQALEAGRQANRRMRAFRKH